MSLRALYGVAGLTAHHLAEYVVSVTGGCFAIHKGKIQKAGVLKDLACVVFLGVDQLCKYHSRIKKDYVAFVVDAPEKLTMVRGLLGLGYTLLKSGNYAYTALGKKEVLDCVVEAMLSDTEVTWSYVPTDPLKILVQNDETDEVMNRLRTLMYAVPNKELRAEVSLAIYRFLTSSQDLANTTRKLNKFLGPVTKEKFRSMLISEQGVKLRQAYRRFKAYPSSADSVCKTYKVSMFTLKYLEAKSRDLGNAKAQR